MDGNVIHEPSKVAAAFNYYFINSVNALSQNFAGSDYCHTPLNIDTPIMTYRGVTNSKVHSIISSLNGSKAKDIYMG